MSERPPKPIVESLNEEDLQKLLDATASGKPHLEDFKDILNKAKANGDEDVFHDRLEKIGITAAKRLGGHEYNAFKEYLAEKYELNDPNIIAETPELDFLRSKEHKISRESKPESGKQTVEMTSRVETSPVPENLPHGSEDDLKKFEEGLTKSVEEWQEKRKEIESSEPSEENTPAVVAEPHVVDAEWEPVSAPRMITDASEPNPTLSSEGAGFTDAQKERLSKEFGEQSEGTHKERWEKLRELVGKFKSSEGSKEKTKEAKETEEVSERGASLKEYLTETGAILQEKAKEYGPKAAEAIGSVVERYNKLKGWQKLAITAALVAGTALSAGVPATMFTAALYGQRVLGGIGMGMNKRKKLDAKIANNPEHWLAGKSELSKNAYVTLLSVGYMAATSFAVHEGVEGLKAAANSEWLGNMLGHDSVQSGLVLTPEELEALAPSTDALENLAPIPDMPEGSSEPLYDPEVDEHITKAREAIERMQKLVDEQANILKSMPDGSETSPSDLPDPESIYYEDRGPADMAAPMESPSSGEEFGPPKDSFMDQDQELKNLIEKQQLGGQSMTEGKIGPDRMFDAQERMEQGLSPGENGQLRGLEHPGGMNDVEKATQYPGTDVFPKPPEEKGFFEKLFGGDQDTAGTFNIDSVSATEPHVYADAEGHLFAYGGSVEDKIETIQNFLTENPDKVIYGTDDSGNYRIPWSLYEGHALPGEPVRTSGFLGFFSSFMDAPKPEEFVKKIK